MEIWKAVVGYEGILEASSLGNIRTLTRFHGKRLVKGKLLNQRKSFGYRIVNVRLPSGIRKTLKVHRLVALAFLPQIKGKEFINHKDTNKSNNNLENLEWTDNKGNQDHALFNGLLKDGTKNRNNKLTAEQVRNILMEEGTISEIGKKYGVAHQTVSSIKRRKIWRNLDNM